MEEKTLEFVADVFRQAEGHKEKACLFIGAGCSASAGIPTAQGIVDEYFAKAQQYHQAYCCAEPKTYANCMRQLSVGEQRNLIERLVAGAKMNWAHIAIACLVRAGYVDRILTTNFDPLVMNACALIGEYPAVYDFAAAPIFISPMIARKAVFHLHGQSTGFVLVNTDEQCNEQFEHIGPLLRDSVAGRLVVVVGYSGENDPVFEHLSKIKRFDFQLFWAGYHEEDPKRHVRGKLLDAGRDAFFVRATDADRFFVGLAQNLGCFPPKLIEKPFSHLLEILAPIPPFPIPTTTGQFDVLDLARNKIKTAIDAIESKEPSKEKERHALLTAKFPAAAAGLKDPAGLKPEERELRAWSLLQEGNQILGKALQAGKEDASQFFDEAANKYEQALEMKPDMHEALYNWGNALTAQARTKTGTEADRLFVAAGDKYEQALHIKPDTHEALNNWGAALDAQAQTKTGADADRLFALAGEKYEQALRIKPDKCEALYNWGIALARLALTKTGAEADRLFVAAGEKFEQALRIKPDTHEALYNWGNALAAWARTKTGAEADRLFVAAGEKYEQALRIRPDKHEALNNWGAALVAQAQTKTAAEADQLFAAAGEKYEQTLRIKPDTPEALNSWGIALAAQAQTKTGAEADRLFAAANDRYLKCESVRPGWAAYNLACAASLCGRDDDCKKWLETSKAAGFLPSRAHIEKDTDLKAVRQRDWFKDFVSKLD